MAARPLLRLGGGGGGPGGGDGEVACRPLLLPELALELLLNLKGDGPTRNFRLIMGTDAEQLAAMLCPLTVGGTEGVEHCFTCLV